MKKENKVSASEMLKNELGLTKAESLFCDLYINGGREFAGQHCKCYREAFQDSGSGVSLKSRRLLGKPHISERIKKLSEQQQTDTEAIAVKLQVTETLKAVMEETSTAKYKDKWGMDLSPAPLRAVAAALLLNQRGPQHRQRCPPVPDEDWNRSCQCRYQRKCSTPWQNYDLFFSVFFHVYIIYICLTRISLFADTQSSDYATFHYSGNTDILSDRFS